MSDLAISGTITRSRLSLSDLAIHDPANGYYLLRDGIGPGGLQWNKVTVESPFVHGRFPVNAVKGAVDMSIGIRVGAATQDVFDQRIAALVNAFEQFSYTLTIALDSVPHSYLCEAADWAVGDQGQWVGLELYSHSQEIRFAVTRSPIPVSGRF